MKKPTIITTSRFHPEVIRTLLEPKCHLVVARNRKELMQALPQADALLVLIGDKVDEALLAHAPKLKVVGIYAVGYNNIDVRACSRRGIAVIHTPKVLTRATAEIAATLLMAVAKRVPEGEKLCRSGGFKGWAPEMLLGQLLEGRHAVIVGAGRIGGETAKLFQALGLTVETIGRKDQAAAIRKKLKRAQVLSLHLPLTQESRHWLNAERLKLLPSDCIVINTARGPVVDEQALIQSLKTRKIFGAGFDVYEHEPEIPAALRALENVVLLPHLGSATAETRREMAQILVAGVLGILSGKRPWNQVKSTP